MVPVLSRELRLGLTPPVGFVAMPDTDEAVEGRLPAFGGCGNEAILIVRRNVLSGLLGVRPLDAERIALRLDVELELDSGDRASDGLGLDGVRNLDNCWYGDAARGVSVGAGVLFLGLGLGRGGNAAVGGLAADRDGWGRADVEAMISFIVNLVRRHTRMQRPCGVERRWLI